MKIFSDPESITDQLRCCPDWLELAVEHSKHGILIWNTYAGLAFDRHWLVVAGKVFLGFLISMYAQPLKVIAC